MSVRRPAVLERVRVVPEPVRARGLRVDEAVRRIQRWIELTQVTGTPCRRMPYWMTVPVVSRIGARCQDAEVEEVGGDRLEVEGVREEREHLVRSTLEFVGSGEHVDAHVVDTSAGGPRIAGPDDAAPRDARRSLVPDCALVMRRLEERSAADRSPPSSCRSRGVPARRAAEAAEAADQQGAFWPFARALLARQGHQELPDLWALAETLGSTWSDSKLTGVPPPGARGSPTRRAPHCRPVRPACPPLSAMPTSRATSRARLRGARRRRR